jgi:hypothetical protein
MFEAAVHVPAVLRLWRAVICYAMLCYACCAVVSAGNWRNALRDSQEVLQLEPNNLKAGEQCF